MRTYGQFCPVARTSELLAERWTPIIIRNLLAGCRTFGQLLDGSPGISRALLAQRLDSLERNDIVRKTPSDDRRVRWTYELTERGRELKQITDAMKQTTQDVGQREFWIVRQRFRCGLQHAR